MEKLPVPRVGTVGSHLIWKGIPSFLSFCAIYSERADLLQKLKGKAETSFSALPTLCTAEARRAPAQVWDY